MNKSDRRDELYNYMIKGIRPKESKSFSTHAEEDGYSLIDHEITEVDLRQESTSLIKRLATTIESEEDSVTIPKEDGLLQPEWAGQDLFGDTGTGTFTTVSLFARLLYSQVKVEQRLLEDSPHIIDYILRSVKEGFEIQEEITFINGINIGMPKGFLKYSSNEIEQIHSGVAGNFATGNEIFDLYSKLRPEFHRNVSIITSPSVAFRIRNLHRSAGSQHVHKLAGSVDLLDRIPMYETPHMPGLTSGSLAVAMGDFKRGYTRTERTGINIQRDDLTAKPHVRFVFTKRLGGAVTNFDAIKLLKLSV